MNRPVDEDGDGNADGDRPDETRQHDELSLELTVGFLGNLGDFVAIDVAGLRNAYAGDDVREFMQALADVGDGVPQGLRIPMGARIAGLRDTAEARVASRLS